MTPETVLAKVTEWRHSRLDFWTDAPFHTHEFVEIVFVMEGGGTHQICNGEELFSMRLTKGDVLFINPGDLHTYLFANSEEYLVVKNLIIVPSLLEGGYLYQYAQMEKNGYFCSNRRMPLIGRMGSSLHLREEELQEVSVFLETIKKEGASGSPYHGRRLELQLTLLLYQLDEFLQQREHRNHTAEQIDPSISEAIFYIQSHYCEDITVEDIVQQACCSRRKLERTYKYLTNETLVESINRLRINRACQLLLNSGMKITEVISAVGMNNMSYFNRIFKEQMNMTPSQFRRKFRQEQEKLLT